MLFTMLVRQAPKLLALLQNSDSAEMLPNITSALDNGYDPGLIEDAVSNSIFPTDLDNLYDPNRGLESGFPTLSKSLDPSLTTNALEDIYKESADDAFPMPAAASASSMLLANPNIGEEINIPEESLTSYTTPNPSTGMSEEDWDYDELDDVADNPYALNALYKKLRNKRR